MASDKILLSISILVSNRPDTVEKCLQSLNSLRRRVASELILVDTGCGEQVRKIIESYTDIIVDFEWCNDFSKARNAGLRLAKGEWFLYLDDDEWFEDTDDIEDFFVSGRHLNYNYGHYLQRNYFDSRGKIYRDVYVGRLVRLLPDVEFIYSIHEGFTNARTPLIRLNSYVHHYGYFYENEEAMQKHSRRNIELLLAEHKKDPSELRHILQLAQEYNVIKAWDKSIKISQEGIKNAVPGLGRRCFLGGLYANIVRVQVILKQYGQAVVIGEKYLKMDEPDELARAAVYYYLCVAYLEMGENTKSLEAVQRYDEIYEKWKQDKDKFIFYENILTDRTFSEESVKAVLYRGVHCGIKLGNARLAKRYFSEIKWDIPQKFHDLAVVDMIRELVKVWLQTDADRAQEYTFMMKTLLNDGTLARMVVTEMENSSELMNAKRADWKALADKNWIFLYFKVKNQTEKVEREELIADYHNLWREPKDILMRANELNLWEMAQRDGIQMRKILSDIPIYRWRQAVGDVIQKMDWQDVQELQSHLQETLPPDSFHMIYWNIPYRLRRICVMAADKDGEWERSSISIDSVIQELLAYALESHKIYSRLYREELFRDTPGFLPRECQLSERLLEMADAMEEGNLQKALTAVREALEIMPELSEALKCCTKWISEKSVTQNVEQEKIKNEMSKLAEAIKTQVRNMAMQGMLVEAAGALHQLKALVPEDEEVLEMEKAILQTQLDAELGEDIR